MTTTIQNLWTYIQSMHLSTQNKQWLAERLLEGNVSQKRRVSVNKKDFPKIDMTEPLSDEVLSMSCSDVASDFDFEKELDKMYMEWAR